ncbi:hypothetical protein [Acinetobacter seifertii]|uniref:hypothetical protein n=1 Tax=Acinetobacter seifertii TaxID=1530123 RepID=UPI0019055CA3|nr:hypothetical protein [Acinetobacter seifertii]MBJ9425196.1 hypothetical protein [Acinetobacter seifertii]
MAVKVKVSRKPRITKKINSRAAKVLIKLGAAKHSNFGYDECPDKLMFWFRTGGWDSEWDCKPAYDFLLDVILDEIHGVFDGYLPSFTDLAYINTPQRIFKLAKHLYLAKRLRGELHLTR